LLPAAIYQKDLILYQKYLSTFVRMANDKADKQLLRLVAIDTIKKEKELTVIITRIVDIIAAEDMDTEKKIRELRNQTDSLDNIAGLVDLKIQAKVINRIRKAVLKVIKESTNKMILSTIRPGEN
jgi:hypothetical protein